MAGGGSQIWLYLRMGGLALVILFALQLFTVNAILDGEARVLPWWSSNFWSLAAAFAMGLVLWPLARAVKLTWKDYEEAQRQAREAAAREEPAARPTGAGETTAGRQNKVAAGGGSDAADVWTAGEEDQRSR